MPFHVIRNRLKLRQEVRALDRDARHVSALPVTSPRGCVGRDTTDPCVSPQAVRHVGCTVQGRADRHCTLFGRREGKYLGVYARYADRLCIRGGANRRRHIRARRKAGDIGGVGGAAQHGHACKVAQVRFHGRGERRLERWPFLTGSGVWPAAAKYTKPVIFIQLILGDPRIELCQILGSAAEDTHHLTVIIMVGGIKRQSGKD